MTIARYTRPEMKEIWSDDTKYQTWLEVEIEAQGVSDVIVDTAN